MGSSHYGGITRSGSEGSYTYGVKAGMGSKPVAYVSFWGALRFANWLNNGQPTGAQDSSTTEDGAYTITEQGIYQNSITRNAEATIFLPSEDEWYKAAYFNGTSYFDYPAGADAQTVCVLPSGDTGNSANCWMVVDGFTDVGAYSHSAGPYGTFDQGGNIWEWNETIISGSNRGMRGGSVFDPSPGALAAWDRAKTEPHGVSYGFGFRVAMIPEPSTALLLALGLAGLAAVGRRRA
jgi:formylglycine-generating enzyme required for sulfatase activity